MTAHDRFDRMEPRLQFLLTELAAPSVPDYTEALLTRTSTLRQRPRWTFIERWLPMGVIARERTLNPGIPWRAVALAAILAMLITTALLIVGTQRKLPPAFGLAANGSLLLDRGGDIYVRDTIIAPSRLLVGGPEQDFAPGFTRDGTRMSFLRLIEDRPEPRQDLIAVVVANLDGSRVRQLTGPLEAPDWFDWSPDGKQLVVQMTVKGVPGIHLIDVDSGEIRPLRDDMAGYTPNYRGPDGKEIIFRGWIKEGIGPRAAILSIYLDGTGLRALTPLERDLNNTYLSPQVSPDGQTVAYSDFDDEGAFRVHLLDMNSGRIDALKLGPEGGEQGWASFSPDGSLLVFHWIADHNTYVQVMLAPVDGSYAAVPIGPQYPIVNGSASVSQGFSPDGTFVIINHGRDREIRLVEVAKGGLGEVLPWDADGIPSWQRLPIDR